MTVSRTAEARLRAGNLQGAIDEYVRLLDERPDDVVTSTRLAHLYVRAGDSRKAVERLSAVAGTLYRSGEARTAAGVAWRILAIEPDNEGALLQLAETAIADGRPADACAHLAAAADHRSATGNRRGAGELQIRIASLMPGDVDAQLTAAYARQEAGDPAGALQALKNIGLDLLRRNRFDEASTTLQAAIAIDPQDDDLRTGLFDLYAATGDLTRARDHVVGAEQALTLTAALDAVGRHDEALDLLRDAVRRNPEDLRLRASIARHHVLDGDAAAAAEHLTVEMGQGDPDALCAIAEIQLRGGKFEEARALLETLVERTPSLADLTARLGCEMACHAPNPAFAIVDIAVKGWAASCEWSRARAALEDYLTRAADCVPALVRLVEVMVESGHEGGASTAQTRLAEAYLKQGDGAQALAVAQDLAEREPSNPENAERVRKALALLGDTPRSARAV